MKRLTAVVLVALMVVTGAALATAAELPQALKGVNLNTAKVVTPDQAQQVRGMVNNWIGYNMTAYNYSNRQFNGKGPYNANQVNWYLYYQGAPPNQLPPF